MNLGPILWSPKTGSQHRGAFDVPIAYLIELESFQIFWLLAARPYESSKDIEGLAPPNALSVLVQQLKK